MAESERDWKRAYEDERAIVDRVWKALGCETYDDCKPFAIDEHVTRLRAECKRLTFQLEYAKGETRNAETLGELNQESAFGAMKLIAAQADEAEKERDKWKERAKLFQEAHKDKAFEVFALTLQNEQLERLGTDATLIKQRDSMKEKLMGVVQERNEAKARILALTAERDSVRNEAIEECAKVADARYVKDEWAHHRTALRIVAAAIRALKSPAERCEAVGKGEKQ